MTSRRVVVDVGGTNARFAMASEGNLANPVSYPTARFATFMDALAHFLSEAGDASHVAGIAIGAAGPLSNGEVKLTNGPWRISEREVSAALGGKPARVINDLAAVAHALPDLEPGDVTAIGNANSPDAGENVCLALNVGTGFGAAAMVRSQHGWVCISTEPGHMGLAPDLATRAGLDDGSSVEDLLSGPGLENFFRKVAGDSSASFDFAGDDPASQKVALLFSEALGRIAGDMVLATGAWRGVFLCGGVVDGWHPYAGTRMFLDAFQAKGAMSGRMAKVFCGVITKKNVALEGLSRLSLEA